MQICFQNTFSDTDKKQPYLLIEHVMAEKLYLLLFCLVEDNTNPFKSGNSLHGSLSAVTHIFVTTCKQC